jgi:hypothetical protein
MPAKIPLQLVAVLTVAAHAVFAAIRGSGPDTASEWLAPVAPAVLAAGALLWLFDRHAWRWQPVRPFTGRPLMYGTWHGTLTTTWEDPATGVVKPPDPNVFLIVRQRFWSVTVRLLTSESGSASFQAELLCDAHGVYELAYLYSNRPSAAVRHRSTMHMGAAIFDVPSDPSDGFQGEYFTGRRTEGDMTFHTRYPAIVSNHPAALRMVAEAG